MKKIPFPVSIDEELAEKIKNEAEKKGFRNKSHLVETAIKKFFEEESK
ncbi:ribbon-helix-helix protein, CopG family [Candidatus Woesearchaeota archaeon]|nr:ribbon-helix-helix protein, CopG family [Candidatus Woesearchaeota archaeon]